MHSNPNRDVIHRWREAYPALEKANSSTLSMLVQTNVRGIQGSELAEGETHPSRRLMRRIPLGLTQPSPPALLLHKRRAWRSATLAPSMWTAAFQQPPASLQRCGGRVRPPAAALTRHPSDGKSAPPAHTGTLSSRIRNRRTSSSRQDLLDRECRCWNFFGVVRSIDQNQSVAGALRRESINNQLSSPILIANPDRQPCYGPGL